MKTLRFKTTIKCNGCLVSVRPQLNAIKGVEGWDVDLNSPDSVLSVDCEDDLTDLIISAVERAGHKLSKIDE
jgi:copper chaperone